MTVTVLLDSNFLVELLGMRRRAATGVLKIRDVRARKTCCGVEVPYVHTYIMFFVALSKRYIPAHPRERILTSCHAALLNGPSLLAMRMASVEEKIP